MGARQTILKKILEEKERVYDYRGTYPEIAHHCKELHDHELKIISPD